MPRKESPAPTRPHDRKGDDTQLRDWVVLAAGELSDGARDLCVAERAGAAARATRVTGSDEDRASRRQVQDYRSVGTMREPSLAVLVPRCDPAPLAGAG